MPHIGKRDDWDYQVLDAFLHRSNLPDDALFLSVAGAAFKRYISACAPSIARLTSLSFSAIARELVAANARYFRVMATAISTGPAELPGWERCRQQITAHLGAPSVIVSFQLGFPLLLPLAANTTSQRATVFMHSRNLHAHQLMQRATPPIEILDVEKSSAFGALRALRLGRHVLANIDTAYDGTRPITLELLGGSIEAPAGPLTALPERLGAPLFAAAIIMTKDGLEASIRPIATDEAPAQLSTHFGQIIGEHPFQWMGWGSFRR